jgi:hypothetical protein
LSHGFFFVAAQFYIQGAQWGDCDCMFNLGCCFELGVGINKDVAKAVEWYRRAALEHNDAEAMKVLTRVYMSLDDEENALLFAKRLAEEKQQPEQLIKCLVRGIGTAVDLDAARRLGWDGNDEFDSEQMEIDEEGEEEADEGEEEKILGETPQVTSLRSKREQQDELAAAESKRSKRDGGQVKTPVAFAQSPVKTNESPKGFPLFGANSPIRFIASSPRQQQLSVSPVPKGQQPVVSPIVRGQRNAVMSDWSIDQVVGYFLELGCDEKETSELRKQKIDGFALTRITDWRILFHDLAIPMGCCLKHDALMSKK